MPKYFVIAEGKLAYFGDIPNAIDFFKKFSHFSINLNLISNLIFIFFVLISQNIPVPPNYNPADHFIKKLALMPDDRENSLKEIQVNSYYTFFLENSFLISRWRSSVGSSIVTDAKRYRVRSWVG